ncbi:hypothetical protein Syun_022017 [Stephania yunnanensis]|uniref:Uncharacterized protein n=1 Tax=Stephania yunnanensis TaxID=152371 RepID=A0AAP0IH54_9MAGN
MVWYKLKAMDVVPNFFEEPFEEWFLANLTSNVVPEEVRWPILFATASWSLWKSRNKEVIANEKCDDFNLVSSIWAQAREIQSAYDKFTRTRDKKKGEKSATDQLHNLVCRDRQLSINVTDLLQIRDRHSLSLISDKFNSVAELTNSNSRALLLVPANSICHRIVAENPPPPPSSYSPPLSSSRSTARRSRRCAVFSSYSKPSMSPPNGSSGDGGGGDFAVADDGLSGDGDGGGGVWE